MNLKNIINFLLLIIIVGVIIFFYKTDIQVIEKEGYVDFTNRFVGNEELLHIEDYINKNNITHIRIDAKNLDLNRIAELELINRSNITFEVLQSQDLDKTHIWGYLIQMFKQIILTSDFEQKMSQMLTVKGDDYYINITDKNIDEDMFELLFLLKDKKIKNLYFTGGTQLIYFSVFIDFFLDFSIENIHIYDALDSKQYENLHSIAMGKKKKIFFSNKPEIQRLRYLNSLPKDLILDYMSGGLEIKDILDINTLFGKHEFNLLSIKQNALQEYSFYSGYYQEEKYAINLEFLNKYIHYKKANLIGNNVKFNKGFDICNQKNILYVSNLIEFQDSCGFHYFRGQENKRKKIFQDSLSSLFTQAIFDFLIEKKYYLFQYAIEENSFEEFWLSFNVKKYFYQGKLINPDDLPNTEYLNKSINHKEKFEIAYNIYLKYLIGERDYLDIYNKYSEYVEYSQILAKEFNIQINENEYFSYLNGKIEYFQLSFYDIIDNRDNNGILIFYTKKDE